MWWSNPPGFACCRMEVSCKAARASVQYLVDSRNGDTDAAKADRKRAETLVHKAQSFVYVGLDGDPVPVSVGDGVIDTFIARALGEG